MQKQSFRPSLTILEGRTVPTAFIANLSGGVLSVVGTSDADAIDISTNALGQITVADQAFDASQVQSIRVTAGSGDDTVTISSDIHVAAYVLGGAGNDAVFGGSGNDYLSGGDGDDILVGGAGHDVLRTGSGFDLVDGGLGHDVVVSLLPPQRYDPLGLNPVDPFFEGYVPVG